MRMMVSMMTMLMIMHDDYDDVESDDSDNDDNFTCMQGPSCSWSCWSRRPAPLRTSSPLFGTLPVVEIQNTNNCLCGGQLIWP